MGKRLREGFEARFPKTGVWAGERGMEVMGKPEREAAAARERAAKDPRAKALTKRLGQMEASAAALEKAGYGPAAASMNERIADVNARLIELLMSIMNQENEINQRLREQERQVSQLIRAQKRMATARA